MSDFPQKPLPEDDFDIELFAQKIYRVWKSALSKLLYPFRLIFYKPIRFVVFILLAGIAAVGLKLILPKVYKAQMVIVPSNRADLNVVSMLYDLETLSKNNDKEGVCELLGMPEANADALGNIRSTFVWVGLAKDTLRLIKVELEAKELALFPVFQQSLLKYLENNEHYALVKQLRLKEIANMQQKLKSEMDEIDSLKGVMKQNMVPRSSGGFVYGEPLDPVRIYETSLNLYRQQMSLNWQQNFIKAFELVKPFITGKKPAWPKLSYLLLFTGSISLLVLMFINQRELSKTNVG